MSKIVQFHNYAQDRLEYQFINRPVLIHDSHGEASYFPCISLFNRTTNSPVACPDFERWLFNMNKAERQSPTTLKQKASHLCTFLNFLLWNTSINSIYEINIETLRQFLKFFRRKDNGEERSLEGWNRGIGDVYDFLCNYYYYNKDNFDFQFTIPDLISAQSIVNSATNRKAIIKQYNKFSVKPPRRKKVKNRLLLHGYLDFLLYECEVYDPMIKLAVALGAYAGLREGETVNQRIGSISPVYAGFGRIGKVVIDLTKDAPFSKEWTGKKPFGEIKVHREQEVYPDFIPELMELYSDHLLLLEQAGYDTSDGAPLFVNSRGEPMNVDAYAQRLKKVFKEHFIPDLRNLSMRDGSWPENAAFVEAYEKCYPGAHMLRHWYTMYLVTKTKLSSDEISKWRGDRNRESMLTYLHVNADMIAAYENSLYLFQQSMLEEVL